MDVRSNAIVRAAVDKDTVRLANHNAVQGDDRSSIGIDGWEKSKMKKKRSGIKTDASSSLASNKAVDGYRDLKQGIPKSAGDSRLRLNGDSNMSRYGLLLDHNFWFNINFDSFPNFLFKFFFCFLKNSLNDTSGKEQS